MKLNKTVIVFLLLAYLTFNKIIFDFFVADLSSTFGKKILTNGEISQANEYLVAAGHLNEYEPTYKRNKALMYLSIALSGMLNEEEVVAIKKKAYEELKVAYTLQPINLVNLKSLIPMYYFLSLKDISDPTKGYDEEYRSQAIIFFRQIRDAAPTDADLALSIGKNLKLLGAKEDARKSLERAVSLKPDMTDARIELESL